MKRDDVADGEDDGAESESSNVVPPPLQSLDEYDQDGYDDSDDDDDDDDGDRDIINPLNIHHHQVSCPCCRLSNTVGYICPDGVRMDPLPPTATYADFQARRLQPQPGHTRCRRCAALVPLIPDTAPADIANRFQCKTILNGM